MDFQEGVKVWMPTDSEARPLRLLKRNLEVARYLFYGSVTFAFCRLVRADEHWLIELLNVISNWLFGDDRVSRNRTHHRNFRIELSCRCIRSVIRGVDGRIACEWQVLSQLIWLIGCACPGCRAMHNISERRVVVCEIFRFWDYLIYSDHRDDVMSY